jgi:hypothetical protein
VLCRAAPEPSSSSERLLLHWKQIALIGVPVLLAIVLVAFNFPTKRGRHVAPNPGDDAGYRFSNDLRGAEAAENESSREVRGPMESERARAARLESERPAELARDRSARLDEYFDGNDKSGLPSPSASGIERRMREFDIEVMYHYETTTRLCETIRAYGMRCRQRAITSIRATPHGDEPLPPSLSVDGSWASIDVSSDEKVIESLRRHARSELVSEYFQRERGR